MSYKFSIGQRVLFAYADPYDCHFAAEACLEHHPDDGVVMARHSVMINGRGFYLNMYRVRFDDGFVLSIAEADLHRIVEDHGTDWLKESK